MSFLGSGIVVLIVAVVGVTGYVAAADRPRTGRVLARHPILAGALIPSVLALPLIALLMVADEGRGAAMVAMVYANAIVAFAFVVTLRPPEK
ncbi:hypothetical protein GCM10010191_29610 [Actinomadura vinacea]|uniref:Uncharacterized protein n=1 Tax=Actinomadura vinacea TaxID=115336 RepID=A0ABN3IZY8_9ACTN